MLMMMLIRRLLILRSLLTTTQNAIMSRFRALTSRARGSAKACFAPMFLCSSMHLRCMTHVDRDIPTFIERYSFVAGLTYMLFTPAQCLQRNLHPHRSQNQTSSATEITPRATQHSRPDRQDYTRVNSRLHVDSPLERHQ